MGSSTGRGVPSGTVKLLLSARAAVMKKKSKCQVLLRVWTDGCVHSLHSFAAGGKLGL